MEKYNYAEAVAADVASYIEENYNLKDYAGNREGLISDIENDSNVLYSIEHIGSWEAAENVCHNLDLLQKAIAEDYISAENAIADIESADNAIRQYMLYQVIEEAVSTVEANQGIDLDDEMAFINIDDICTELAVHLEENCDKIMEDYEPADMEEFEDALLDSAYDIIEKLYDIDEDKAKSVIADTVEAFHEKVEAAIEKTNEKSEYDITD